jgi:DNA-binding HxlR family transcriptional regulator
MTTSHEPARRTGCRSLIEDKWALRIVSILGAGPRRFTELRRTIDGVSQRMLTVTLRSLERDGILTRSVYAVMPPNVTYELTPMGAAFLRAAAPLLEWATEAQPGIDAARAEYDARPPAGTTPNTSGPHP